MNASHIPKECTYMRAALGKDYPRTCKECGFGPCKGGLTGSFEERVTVCRNSLSEKPFEVDANSKLCACSQDIHLVAYSGGASKEGLYGRIRVSLNGEVTEYEKVATPVRQGIRLDWRRDPNFVVASKFYGVKPDGRIVAVIESSDNYGKGSFRAFFLDEKVGTFIDHQSALDYLETLYSKQA